MISATPNSVRWDHVNRVTYRFQALNFQSDVLEALVMNSPPLTRKSRRKPIIRVPVEHISSQKKIDFIKPKKTTKRSFSFDDEFTDLMKDKGTLIEKEYSSKRDTSRISSCGYVTSPQLRECFASVDLELKINDDATKDSRNGIISAKKKADHELLRNCDDEDLESKSKQHLIELVKDLRSQLAEKADNHFVTKRVHEKDTSRETQICYSCRRKIGLNLDVDGGTDSAKDAEIKETLLTQMKQLETEVQRTRKIATMFENELSCLKEKFSTVINQTEHVKRMTTNDTKGIEPSHIRQVCNGLSEPSSIDMVMSYDRPQETCERQIENDSIVLSNTGTSFSRLDDVVNVRNCDVVSALG